MNQFYSDIRLQLSQLMHALPFYCSFVDTKNVIRGMNQSTLDLVGVSSPDDIIGKTDYDLPCDASLCAPQFEKENAYVLKTQTTLRTLCLCHYKDGDFRVLTGKKSPLFDNEGKLLGTLNIGLEYKCQHIYSILSGLIPKKSLHAASQKSYKIDNHIKGIKLKDMHSMTLFLLAHRLTAKEIALVLKRSFSTIEDYLRRLRQITNTATTSQLVDYAIASGLLDTIPSALFKKTNISLILK